MISFDALALIAIFLAIGWFWLDSARAREIATGLARTLCSRHGVQFLDGTASLIRLGMHWTRSGVRWRRVFRFDYSEAGIGRYTGHIALLGMELEDASLGLPGDAELMDTPADKTNTAKRIGDSSDKG